MSNQNDQDNTRIVIFKATPAEPIQQYQIKGPRVNVQSYRGGFSIFDVYKIETFMQPQSDLAINVFDDNDNWLGQDFVVAFTQDRVKELVFYQEVYKGEPLSMYKFELILKN